MAKHKYYQKFKQYTLVCSDPDETILKLLSEIHKQTICGHSFDVIVDFEDKDSSKVIEEIKKNLGNKFPDYSFSIIEDKDFSD